MKTRGRIVIPENHDELRFLTANLGERVFIENAIGEKVEVYLYHHTPSNTIRFVVAAAIEEIPHDLKVGLLKEGTNDVYELLNDAILLINT